MADSFNDGRIAVWDVPTIANIAAPTVAELNAGFALQCLIDADGGIVGFEPETAEIPNDKLCSVNDSKTIGRESYSNTMIKLYRQGNNTDTDATRARMVRGYTTYIVIRRDLAETTAWAANQKVEVFPVICAGRKEEPYAKNSVHKYNVPTMITGATNLNAVVAA